MIISRTPFRISFFGGGTDYPEWYKDHGGAVLATTFNKYCYITCRYLPPFFEHKSRIIYSKMEQVKTVEDINHPVVRETLKFLKIHQGIEIHHDGDLPARAGLGSSSSFTVGLLSSLYALIGKMSCKEQLAKEAIFIEKEKCGENVGCQDQVLAAHGGLNFVTFGGDEHINIQKVTIPKMQVKELQSYMMLYFTGFSRFSSEIAEYQIKNIPNKRLELMAIRQMTDQALNFLKNNDLKSFGCLLDESWKVKKQLSDKITTPEIDNIYNLAKQAGALGGKVLGAGGGGFMLIFADPLKQEAIKKKLKKLLLVPIELENTGSQIIFYRT